MLIMFFWLCLSSISFVVLHWFSSDNVRRNQNEIVAEQKHLNSKDGKRKGHSCEEASSGKDTSDTKVVRVGACDSKFSLINQVINLIGNKNIIGTVKRSNFLF